MGEIGNLIVEKSMEFRCGYTTKTITSNYSMTAEDVLQGITLLCDTSGGAIIITLPQKSTLTADSHIRQFRIAQAIGGNNVRVQGYGGTETFVYGNTYFDLGQGYRSWMFGAINTGAMQNFGLMRDLTVRAEAHRDASWASANFSSMTIIPWDAEPVNTQTELLVYTSGASARYTVKTAGTYRISYTIDLDSTGGSTWNATAQVYKNGSALESTQTRTGNYGNEDQSMALPSVCVNLLVDDYLDLRIDQNSLTGNMVHSLFNVSVTL